MNKIIVSVILMTLVGTSVQAASVTIATSVSCNTDLGSLAGSSSCTQAGTFDTVTASASDSYSISGNTLTFSSSVEALVSATIGGLSGDTASASDSLTLYFVTSGPARTGIVYVPVSYAAGPFLATGSFTLANTLGSICFYSEGCILPVSFEPYQVALGTTLELTETSSASAEALNQGGMAYLSALGYGATFEFFEADGVTPVDVSVATPEPTTLGLLLLFVALSTWRRSLWPSARLAWKNHAKSTVGTFVGTPCIEGLPALTSSFLKSL